MQVVIAFIIFSNRKLENFFVNGGSTNFASKRNF